MITIFRKNQRTLMLIVAILTIIAFIFLYNTAELDQLSAVRDPKIYGRSLNAAAIDRQVKNYQLTMALGQYDLLAKLGGAGMDRDESLNAFVWNLLVLQHEARTLGVEPTIDQVADRIKGLPVFHTEGQFDPAKYSTFLREQLAPRGFTERQLEEVMRDSLRLERISAIVEAPAAVSEAEMRSAAKILRPITATAILFDASQAAAAATVSDEEIGAYYERNLPSLNTEETRAVRYVAFELPVGAKPEGKEKVEAMQKLADAATAFIDNLAAPGATFDSAAASGKLTVRETPTFDRSGTLPAAAAIGGDSAKELESIVLAVAPEAFLLRATGATSDVIQAGDAFFVIELSQLTPERPLTLEEATPSIRERLLALATEKLIRENGETKATQIREALASGKPLADAVAAAGAKTERLDAVVPTSETLTPEQRRFIFPTLALQDGELSAFEAGPDGGFAVFLESRGVLDDKAFDERRAEIQSGLLENKRQVLFAEWLRTAFEAANLTIPGARGG